MPIDDAIEAIVIVLQPHPVVERAYQMTEVQLSGRPHSAKNSGSFHGRTSDYRTAGRPGTMCYNRRHACRAAEARAGPVFPGLCALRAYSATQKTNPLQ